MSQLSCSFDSLPKSLRRSINEAMTDLQALMGGFNNEWPGAMPTGYCKTRCPSCGATFDLDDFAYAEETGCCQYCHELINE